MNQELLSAKEKTVLGALFASGDATIAQLSKTTLINRTSLYPIVEKLLQYGVVTSIQSEGKQYIQPIRKAEFKEWIQRKKSSYINATKEIEEWAESHTESTTLATETKYYQGHDGVKALYHDSWRDNAGKEILALTDYAKAYDTMGEFFDDDYFQMRVKKGIHVKSLLPRSPAGIKDLPKAKALLRDVKFIELFEHLGIELNIYDDKISLVSFDTDMPTGVLIKNKIIADAFKEIFQFLWKHGEKPKQKDVC